MAFYTTEKIGSYRRASEILEIIEAFEHCTLPLSRWNNETYLTVAFWYLYLNSLPEARHLISAGITRFNFENNLSANQFSLPDKAEISLLLTAIHDCIKIYKGESSFVELANLVLKRFANSNRQLKNYRRAQMFFPGINPLKAEESR